MKISTLNVRVLIVLTLFGFFKVPVMSSFNRIL